MGPHAFEQIPASVSGKGQGEMLLGGSQNALQAHHNQIGQQMDPHRFWPPAHEFLHEVRDTLAESGLDFTLSVFFCDGLSPPPPATALSHSRQLGYLRWVRAVSRGVAAV